MTRWVVAVIAALAVVALLAFARGREHQRGDETGGLEVTVSVVDISRG